MHELYRENLWSYVPTRCQQLLVKFISNIFQDNNSIEINYFLVKDTFYLRNTKRVDCQ